MRKPAGASRYLRRCSSALAAIVAAALLNGLGTWFDPTAATAVPTAAAPVAVHRACVDKRTGRLRYVTKAKCRKGERLITWNRPGPAGGLGAAGPAGPSGGSLVVKDATGALVPNVVAVSSYFVSVLVGSGVYEYGWDGAPSTLETLLVSTTADCSGTKSLPFSFLGMVAGSFSRLVIKNPDGITSTAYMFGPPVTVPGGATVSFWVGSPAVCTAVVVPSAATLQTLIALGAPPPNLPGPLTLSLT